MSDLDAIKSKYRELKKDNNLAKSIGKNFLKIKKHFKNFIALIIPKLNFK